MFSLKHGVRGCSEVLKCIFINFGIPMGWFEIVPDILTLVLSRGDGGYPLTVCLQPHKNTKESDPGHLGHLFYILCGHFDDKKKKKTGVPLKMGVG